MKKILLPIASLLFSWSVSSQTLTLPLTEGGTGNGGTILEVDLADNSYTATSIDGLSETSELNQPFGNRGGIESHLFGRLTGLLIYIRQSTVSTVTGQ